MRAMRMRDSKCAAKVKHLKNGRGLTSFATVFTAKHMEMVCSVRSRDEHVQQNGKFAKRPRADVFGRDISGKTRGNDACGGETALGPRKSISVADWRLSQHHRWENP